MKRKISFKILLTFLIGFSPFYLLSAQTYTVSPSTTTKPSIDVYSNGVKWYACTTDGSTWIRLSASVNGSEITFTASKNSGTFNNNISIILRKNVTISGTTVTNSGVMVRSKNELAGSSGASVTITPDFISGSNSYIMTLTSGSIVFYTNPITVTASGGTVLATPDYTSFYATNISTTSFRARWSAVAGATKYGIRVKKASQSSYSNPIIEDEINATSYYVDDLQPGTTYHFSIQARNGNSSQNSEWSSDKAITTDEEITQLSTPNNSSFVGTNISSTGFTAKWAAVSGATKYGILVRSASGSFSNPEFEAEVSSTSCKVTGLKPETPYYFRIQARNNDSSKNSDWSQSITDAITTSAVSPQNYTVSPSITTKPSTEKVTYNSKTWHGYTNNGTYIQAYAVVDGNKSR